MSDWLQLGLFLLVICLLTKPIGLYLVKVLDPKEKTFLDPIFKPFERWIYRLSRIDPFVEQNWKQYLGSVLIFSLVSLIVTMALLGFQSYLPLNPEKFGPPSWDLNLNTAVSFMTNTNWQSYGGESTMSYFSQMAALTVQNFASAAVGIAASASLVRGLSRKEKKTIGNFWADLVRLCLYVLLPFSVIAATLLMAEGVPQNLNDYVQAKTVEGEIQKIPQGPIASQEAIKLLGTNGGGFTNTNSAHPYENPTPFSNFLQITLIFLLSSSLIYYFGKSIDDVKHAWCLFIALIALFIIGFLIVISYENIGNPKWAELGVFGSNWEGKEQRFGIFNSALFACVTTVTSCGAVNCSHDSLMPIGGFIPLLNMQLSETIVGGVGAGLYSILLFIFLSIFIAGLIIGRTPEYLGNKIEIFEIKMTVLANLSYVVIVLFFTALASVCEWGVKGLSNSGPHGFTEMLYAYSSTAANNGSAFAGLSASSVPYNVTLALAMFLGRFCCMAPVIALAGSLVQKKIHPKTTASFPVSSAIFISFFVSVILLLGALNFLPSLTLGPILEQFFILKGVLFP